MYCPNCASKNESSQHFCRTCGLKLDAIVAEVEAQRPSEELGKLLKRKRKMEMLGIVSLAITGIIGVSLILGNAIYYKLQFLSANLLFGSASVALLVFALSSIFFLFYPKFSRRFDRLNSRLSADPEVSRTAARTNKLLEDPPFEPASVTEHSTRRLKTPR